MSFGKVLVVEDDSFTRTTLCKALESEGFLTPDAAGNAADALSSWQKNKHQVVLADLDLGQGPSGVELAWRLRQLDHQIGIVFLTSFEDPRLHRQHRDSLPPGAIYLVKQELADLKEISKALKAALDSSLSPSAPLLQTTSLSDVQIETLRLVAEGMSNSEIAKRRFVSEKAVEQTIKKIAEELGIASEGKNLRVLLANAYFKLTGGKK